MLTVATAQLVSRELLVALNNGKFPRATTAPDKKKINLEWKPSPKTTKLPFATVDGKKPTKKQISMAKLFQLISQIVYPYWSYNIKHKTSGSLIIEAYDCKPLSSIMNINTANLLKKPTKIHVAFLDSNKLQIFLQNFHKNNPNKRSIIESTLNTVHSIDTKNEMSIIFAMGGPTFTMRANKNKKLNTSFNSECNKFRKSLQKKGLKRCDYIEIDIGKRQIFAHSLNIIISDPNWMENIKKPDTNCPIFQVFMALNNNGYPSKCDFYGTSLSSELKWEKPNKIYINSLLSQLVNANNTKPRHRRMMRLYGEISHLLYPFWAHNTKHYGMGLIVVNGQRMFNSLDNFVNQKGDLNYNSRKLNAAFLNTKQVMIYLSHFGLNKEETGKPEMEAAAICYQHKSSRIGVLFRFDDVIPMCIRGPISPKSGPYDYECDLFQNMMNKFNMKSCEYLEIDLKQRNVTGFTMDSVYDDRNIVKSEINEKKMNINTNCVASLACGYCKTIKSKMKRCSRCNNMYYCDVNCQRSHWKMHKQHCTPSDYNLQK